MLSLPIATFALSNVLLAYALPQPATSPTDIEKRQGSYVPGWCTFHVVQYQKNEGPPALPPGTTTSSYYINVPPGSATEDYRLDVFLYDAAKNLIGEVVVADAPQGQPVNVYSQLPYALLATTGAVDQDAIQFAYGDQFWNSNTQENHCNFGKYDQGSRSGDCGFTC